MRRAVVGAAVVAAAARAPQTRSVISRVVEQVRDTAGSMGSSGSGMMPRREEEMGGMGGGETDSDMNDEF